jgi:ATP-dependent helicase HrpA
LHTLAAERGAALAEIMAERDTFIHKLTGLRKARATTTPVGSILAEMLADIDHQLAFLFRPGFLRNEDLWRRCPHYFKGLAVRLERLKLEPFKDRTKWEAIRPFQELLDAKLAALPGKRLPPALLRFATLLQEFRVSQFAPEVGTLEKVSPKILQALWANVLDLWPTS